MKNLSKHNISSIKVNNLNYHYISKGTGETIFLLHGFPDTANTWDNFIDVLSKKYHCIAPFLRGYYPTNIPDDSDYSVYTIATDIHSIAKHLKIKSYHIIGHDWGASIAYAMANMFHNEVKRVCTIAMPHPKFLKPSLNLLYKARHVLYFMNKHKAINKIKEDDFSYIEKLYNRWSPNWRNYNKNLESIIMNFKQSKRIEAALGYYWALKNTNSDKVKFYKQLPKSQILVLVGVKDGAILLSQFNKMHLNHRDIFKVIKHPSAGHFLHQEEESFCLIQILDFFKRKENDI